MRKAFIETLLKIAEKDDRVWLITGDLGYTVLEPFQERFAGRFLNSGVAEQNMTGIAAGLALTGNISITYSIANFAVMRCFEQIRNDICYHKANVKIVSVGGGYSYGNLGYTHHGVEDLGVMRLLPYMTILNPADPAETREATKAMIEHAGPCFLRLGKSNEPDLHQSEIDFKIGNSIQLRKGADLTIVSSGSILKAALEVASLLAEKKIYADVWSMPCIKPFDEKTIISAAKKTGKIVTIEEHSILGGLSTCVAETLAKSHLNLSKFWSFAPTSGIPEKMGSQNYLQTQAGLDATNITEKIIREIK